MIISKFFTETVGPFHYKAPKGFMYNIWDIHFVVMASGNNAVGVLNYQLEDQVTGFAWSFANPEGLLAIMDTNITGQAEDFSFHTGEKCKFITLARDGNTAFQLIVIIHYELIKASKIELLMEWFRKGS